MKTAVSIPDEVFEKVERLARRSQRSRSEVFSAALREYVARHIPDEVTEAMDRVCAAVNDENDSLSPPRLVAFWSGLSGDLPGRGLVGELAAADRVGAGISQAGRRRSG